MNLTPEESQELVTLVAKVLNVRVSFPGESEPPPPPPPGNDNCVIDIYHDEDPPAWDKLKEAGIECVIHKATQGLAFKDRKYGVRMAEAKAAGLLFGSYHFGDASAVDAQCDHYLSVASQDDLLALDWENNGANTMSLKQAEVFVARIHARLGRWPVLYSGNVAKEKLADAGYTKPTDTVLGNCPLWLAQYGPRAVLSPVWSHWTFWQYTDGAVGPEPHTVAGWACDRDRYCGSASELREKWPL